MKIFTLINMELRFRIILKIQKYKNSGDKYPKGFQKKDGDTYFGEFDHRSDFYFRKYRDLLKSAFTFPDFTDQRNREIAERMKKGDSVALHVRRGDHMYDNGDLFSRGYFNKAVQHIKNNTDRRQTFYLFSDEMEWCRGHLKELGLDVSDEVVFIDWNKGNENFRDMQLMTYCQHNIIPITCFGWWGYYLSDMKDKIVCAPEGYWLEVENHF